MLVAKFYCILTSYCASQFRVCQMYYVHVLFVFIVVTMFYALFLARWLLKLNFKYDCSIIM